MFYFARVFVAAAYSGRPATARPALRWFPPLRWWCELRTTSIISSVSPANNAVTGRPC